MAVFNTKEMYLRLSDICNKIQESISSKLGGNSYWILAEISGFKITKGHCYITLIEKEINTSSPSAKVSGFIWNSEYEKINSKFKNATGFELKDNIKILFLATVNFHNSFGLNLTIKDIEPGYTIGNMLMEREAIVKKLKEEGNYFLNKKKTFPIVPQRIAVISAADSKGYEDFINKIENNIYKYKFAITLFTSLLQGDKAAEDIKNKLLEIYQSINNFDLVVIVRGGGGAVNLNCFNNYILSKTVARFPIPVITGIGHTSNVSIVDEVAYLDKITPTDVSDYIIEQTRIYEEYMQTKFSKIILKYDEVKNKEIHKTNLKIQNLFHYVENVKRSKLVSLSKTYSKLVSFSNYYLKENRNIVFGLTEKIKNISRYEMSNEKEKLKSKYKSVESGFKSIMKTVTLLNKGRSDKIGYLDPKNVLKKGYSITLRNGKAITSIDSIENEDSIRTILFDGELESTITNKIK